MWDQVPPCATQCCAFLSKKKCFLGYCSWTGPKGHISLSETAVLKFVSKGRIIVIYCKFGKNTFFSGRVREGDIYVLCSRVLMGPYITPGQLFSKLGQGITLLFYFPWCYSWQLIDVCVCVCVFTFCSVLFTMASTGSYSKKWNISF